MRVLTHRTFDLRNRAVINEGAYEAWGPQPVLVEDAEFLFGLVRLIKPRLVWEAGAGYSTPYLAAAVAENEQGRLETWEPRPSTVPDWLWGMIASYPQVTVHGGLSIPKPDELDVLPDFVFLDSQHALRRKDIDVWLDAPVFLVVHDAEAYADLLMQKGGMLFWTPRSLWIRDARKMA